MKDVYEALEIDFEVRNRVNLSDYIIEVLKDIIFSGKLQPGSRLVEDQLARKLKVSKTPLREALTTMQKEGLVENVPYQGKFIVNISPSQLVDTYIVREAVESLAVRLATMQMTRDFENYLKNAEKQMQNIVKGKSVAEFLIMDHAFHNEIIRHANNQTLNSVYDLLINKIRLGKVSTAYNNRRTDESTKEHMEIIEKMLERNPDEAEKSMKKHINNIIKSMYPALGITPPEILFTK